MSWAKDSGTEEPGIKGSGIEGWDASRGNFGKSEAKKVSTLDFWAATWASSLLILLASMVKTYLSFLICNKSEEKYWTKSAWVSTDVKPFFLEHL